MQVIAGLSLKNLKPRVWDPENPYYLPALRAVMVSYAEFHAMPWLRERAMKMGLRKFLGIPPGSPVRVYLDNGAFYFLGRGGEMPRTRDYMDFVDRAKPFWHPIPREWIPAPNMRKSERDEYHEWTMGANRRWIKEGCVPVAHIGPLLGEYMRKLQKHPHLPREKRIALGGIVPNLLRAPKAMPYPQILEGLFDFREEFRDNRLHVFGIGGTATVHLAALVGLDTADSSGWRNRAARGIVQLPGKGDRIIAADLGSWRGRAPDRKDREQLKKCGTEKPKRDACPVCRRWGWQALKKRGIEGFCNRATHNLWVLLQEAEWVNKKLASGKYADEYRSRLDNSVYLPLVRTALAMREERE